MSNKTSINLVRVFSSLMLISASIFYSLKALSQDNVSNAETSSEKEILASNPRFSFDSISNKELESIGMVRDIVRDSDGFLWIGAWSGLTRYDGYNFKVFKVDPANPRALLSTDIYRLSIDSKDRLWLSTSLGAYLYDKNSEEFVGYFNDPNDETSLGSSFLYDIVEDKKDRLWFASHEGGLNYFNEAAGTFQRFLPKVSIKMGFFTSQIEIDTFGRLKLDDDGFFWGACGSFKGKSGGVCRIDPEALLNGKVGLKYYPSNPFDPSSVSFSIVTDTYIGRNNTIWFSTAGGGLNLFDKEKETFKHFRASTEDSFSINSNEVTGFLEDKDGNLIVATTSGLAVVNEINGKTYFQRYTADNANERSILSDQISAMYYDNTGILWLGYFPAGISMRNDYATAFKNFKHDPKNRDSLRGEQVISVAETKDGNLWIGTTAGINFLDRNSDEMERLEFESTELNGIVSGIVNCLFVDSDDYLWIGTRAKGLVRLSPNGQVFEHYENDDLSEIGMHGRSISSVFEDKRGRIWVTTDLALNLYEKKNGHFKAYRRTADFTHAKNMPDTVFSGTAMHEDSRGQFWVGTRTGLVHLNREKMRVEHFVHDREDPTSIAYGSVLKITETDDGQLWISLGGGGFGKINYELDREGNITQFAYKGYTEEDGLASNEVSGLLEDNYGTLWLGTANGLVAFNRESETFKQYTNYHGLLGNLYNTTAALKARDKHLIFGSGEGLTIFDPGKLFENKRAPEVVLTQLNLFNKPVKINEENGLLTQSITQSEQLTFNHSQSVFSLEFSALSLRNPSLNHYAYMLEGFDKDWLDADTSRSATYTNMDAGNYTFRVKASNSDGVWNEKGAFISIKILPPWWRTWWAYAIYVILVIGAIAEVIYLQIRKRCAAELQARALEVKVAERTAELREKNDDIQSMLSNMSQGLFTIEPNGNIHHEYSQYLEKIFECDQIAGMGFDKLLFDNCDLSADQIDQNIQAVHAMIGNDPINFTFNSHLLIGELKLVGGADQTNKKILELMWNPIIESDYLKKLMVTVRDVTHVRQLEQEAESKTRELDIIGEIVQSKARSFITFIGAAESFIAENRRCINSDKKDAALLFRNMHTLKGNARVYNYKLISDAAHIAEHAYQLVQSEPAKWNKEQLLEDLSKVEEVIFEYRDTYASTFGDAKGRHGEDGSWLPSFPMVRVVKSLTSNDRKVVDAFLEKSFSVSVEKALEDNLNAVESIAMQLGKEVPNILVEADNIFIKKSAIELINNVFSHMIRNSMDHGIESPNEREKVNKDSRGKITISAEFVDGKLLLSVSDDGRGLNITRLRKKGIDTGAISADQEKDLHKIANLIFASGMTTKEEVTDISGRGVGMDAVKQFLQDQQGDIEIRIEEGAASSCDYLPFSTVITLTNEHFYVIE